MKICSKKYLISLFILFIFAFYFSDNVEAHTETTIGSAVSDGYHDVSKEFGPFNCADYPYISFEWWLENDSRVSKNAADYAYISYNGGSYQQVFYVSNGGGSGTDQYKLTQTTGTFKLKLRAQGAEDSKGDHNRECSITAKRVIHSYTLTTVSAEHVKSYATCLKPAVLYYSCSCGANGTSTFNGTGSRADRMGAAMGHDCGACTTPTWNVTNTPYTATTTQTCSHDYCDNNKTVTTTCVVTSKITTWPSYTATGVRTYTASGTAQNGKTYSGTRTQTLDKLSVTPTIADLKSRYNTTTTTTFTVTPTIVGTGSGTSNKVSQICAYQWQIKKNDEWSDLEEVDGWSGVNTKTLSYKPLLYDGDLQTVKCIVTTTLMDPLNTASTSSASTVSYEGEVWEIDPVTGQNYSLESFYPQIGNTMPSTVTLVYPTGGSILCDWQNADEDKIRWQVCPTNSSNKEDWVWLEDLPIYENTEFTGTYTRLLEIIAKDYAYEGAYVRSVASNYATRIGIEGDSNGEQYVFSPVVQILIDKDSFFPKIDQGIGALGFTRHGQVLVKMVKISQSSDYHWEYSINGTRWLDIPVETETLNIGGVTPGPNGNTVAFTISSQGDTIDDRGVVATLTVKANDLNMKNLWIRGRSTNNVSGENQTVYTDEQRIIYDMDNFYDWVLYIDKDGNEVPVTEYTYNSNRKDDDGNVISDTNSIYYTPDGGSGGTINGKSIGDIIYEDKRIGYKIFKNYHRDLDGKLYSQ